jgi:hypothetical protein
VHEHDDVNTPPMRRGGVILTVVVILLDAPRSRMRPGRGIVIRGETVNRI